MLVEKAEISALEYFGRVHILHHQSLACDDRESDIFANISKLLDFPVVLSVKGRGLENGGFGSKSLRAKHPFRDFQI